MSPHADKNATTAVPKRESALGISVLIVGGGVAGLMAALEMWRQGLDVQIIERSTSRLTAGDGFSISHTIIRAFNKWPYLRKKNQEITGHPSLAWHNLKGERLNGPTDMIYPSPKVDNSKEDADNANINKNNKEGEVSSSLYRHSRPKFHLMLETQLEQIGLKVQYGKRVVRYFETPEDEKAGVELEDGTTLKADLVVAADGIGSHSTKITLGKEVPARSTGLSVYRAAYPVGIIESDPEILEKIDTTPDGESIAQLWIGDSLQGDAITAHFARNKDEITWAITHKVSKGSSESWSKTVVPEDVFKVTSTIEGWPDYANRVIALTPKDKLLDFELVWRDPQPIWTSSSGRVVQIGDAAHTFLPTAGNGASQGLEDAISLAKCLRIAGNKENITEATKVHNKLRYERVACLQKLGICNQATQYGQKSSGSGETKSKPKYIRMLMAPWTWKHDPENYAEEKYHDALAALKDDRVPFQNTNVPHGCVHKPWNFESLLKSLEDGAEPDLEGDWES
ncbi:hypothetical protein BGW36DRAFT_392919 [Talaromyces proteolyticus]|uniref:FAD-binding domain-containing protein n=1 Tax=Talaromyces proteolyticus TaxID=1131652 RepID=A0AAD4Q3P1_9EURO|nr:uncharacterized protein BGW36DRAFT_392919 [Talaromyces proteolyticus]KAH8705249.1 hypothetical protein BGW36DRAFT_392919 [Talaromyces proteolyticus]